MGNLMTAKVYWCCPIRIAHGLSNEMIANPDGSFLRSTHSGDELKEVKNA
jgi:hypothetical protein